MQEKESLFITLTLNLDEVNIILDALGDRPFREVFELITNINLQATQQLKSNEEEKQE